MKLKKIIDINENFALFYNPSTGQHSIRSIKSFSANTLLNRFTAKEYVQHPTYLSVQVDDNKHIHLFPEFLQYINHSCEPNTFFDTQQGEVIALRDIEENEELSFFYPSTEWSMTQPFECFCGTSSCLGKIQGASRLDSKALAKYRFSAHILNKLKAQAEHRLAEESKHKLYAESAE